MTHKDIYQIVSKKTGYPVKTVEAAVRSFWKGIRFYLANPEKTKKGIVVKNFMKFQLCRGYIWNQLLYYFKRFKRGKDLSVKFERLLPLYEQSITQVRSPKKKAYLNSKLEQIENERQTIERIINKRSSIFRTDKPS